MTLTGAALHTRENPVTLFKLMRENPPPWQER
jgi:hypothetical protein